MLEIINPENLYRLRCGTIVEAHRPDNPWPYASVTIMFNPTEDFPMGDQSCLVVPPDGKMDDPLTWVGGAWGADGDVIEKVTLAELEAARHAASEATDLPS